MPWKKRKIGIRCTKLLSVYSTLHLDIFFQFTDFYDFFKEVHIIDYGGKNNSNS